MSKNNPLEKPVIRFIFVGLAVGLYLAMIKINKIGTGFVLACLIAVIWGYLTIAGTEKS